MGFGGASSTDLPDGKNPERMLIELCSRKGDCVVCGMSTTTEIYFWMQKEDINCTNDKFEASQIKVTIANPKLAPCRIEAHGQGYLTVVFMFFNKNRSKLLTDINFHFSQSTTQNCCIRVLVNDLKLFS